MKHQQNADMNLHWIDSRKHPQSELGFIPTFLQSINLDSKLISMFVAAFFLERIPAFGPFNFAESGSRFSLTMNDVCFVKRTAICRRRTIPVLSNAVAILQSVPGEREKYGFGLCLMGCR